MPRSRPEREPAVGAPDGVPHWGNLGDVLVDGGASVAPTLVAVRQPCDPQQEYFRDGIIDQLITDLSRLPVLFVIASNSSFTTKARRLGS
jgi:hypothetical protein